MGVVRKMYWFITILGFLAVADGSLSDVAAFFGKLIGLKQCPVIPDPPSNDDISCKVRPTSCSLSRFRSNDGSCNNMKHGWWGTPLTPYYRLLDNTYSDGDHAYPKSIDNKKLPNPREMSLNLFPVKKIYDSLWTVGFMQYGQIIAHDLSLTADVGQTGIFVACCLAGKVQPVTYKDPRCASIQIPKSDTFNRKLNRTCINFYRTLTSKDAKNCVGTAKGCSHPLSGVTAYMDVSYLYGSSKEENHKVRAYYGGRLKSIVRYGREFLGQVDDPAAVCTDATNNSACYQAGDIRVNQNPELAVLHNVYMIHHNYVAGKLAKLNPHWDEERIFQETRRIVVAVHQNIFYYEKLVFMLGISTLVNHGVVYIGKKDFVNDYDPNVTPAISIEFSTACFRLFHSEIRGTLDIVTESRKTKSTIKLRDWFLNPSITEPNFAGFCRGMATQPQGGVDKYVTVDIQNLLFKDGKGGDDLKAIDITRGRDHGLGTYPQALEKCCLGKIKTWEDYEKFIRKEDILKLKKFYSSPLDVELVVGTGLEIILPAALTGPVCACILAEQFRRTRKGDLYFFQNNQGPYPFTKDQLGQILDINFGDILCLVPGITQMQPKAFEQVSIVNPLLPCSSRKQFNYDYWKEDPANPWWT